MSSLFGPGREGFLTGEIAWEPGPVLKASLLRGYTLNTAHRFVSQVTGAGGVVVATVTVTSPTYVNGVAGCANFVWPAVPEGDPIPHILVYQASEPTGGPELAPTAQRVIGLIDQANGLPVVPNGQAITYTISPGADRLFRL